MSLSGHRVAVWGDSSPSALAAPIAAAGARILLLHPRGAAPPSGYEAFSAGSSSPADLDAVAEVVWAAGGVSGLVVQPAFAIEDVALTGDDPAAALALEETSWHAALESALELPFFLARAFGARMETAGGGTIILVAAARATRSGALVAGVVREGTITMALGLAKALPRSVRVHVVVAPADAEATSAVAESTCFLLGEPSLPSGTVIRLDRRAE